MKLLVLTTMEKEINNQFIETGLVDMLFGFYYIIMGSIAGLDKLLKLGLIFFGMFIYQLIKDKVITPRIGIYSFSFDRSKIFRFQNIVIALLTFILVVLTILSRMGLIEIKATYFSIIVCLFVLSISFFISIIFSFKRMIIYGLLIIINILFMNKVITLVNENIAVILLIVIPGVIVFTFGLILFYKFIRANDIIEGDDYE